MKRLLALAIICVPFSVQAQEAPQSPRERALSQRVLTEINNSLQCTTIAEGLADQLKAAQAEVKRLTDKYEPKKDKQN